MGEVVQFSLYRLKAFQKKNGLTRRISFSMGPHDKSFLTDMKIALISDLVGIFQGHEILCFMVSLLT